MSIRAFVLSDLHIGDRAGMVVAGRDGRFQSPLRIRSQFLDFLARVAALKLEHKPLLVLAGDVWDVAVDNIDDVATLSWDVFEELREGFSLFESILFLPGNHDHALWTLLQTQTCVIRPLDRRAAGDRTAKAFPLPHAQEALLDFTKGPHPELEIPGVKPPYTGNVFLTGFTGGTIPVNVSYPNLAIRRADGRHVVVTHGQFFEQAWTLLSDLILPATEENLPKGRNLASLEMLNASLTDFINYSLAQMGPLNDVLQQVYEDFRVGREPPQFVPVMKALHDVLDRAADDHDRSLKGILRSFRNEIVIDIALALVKHYVRANLENAKSETILPSGRAPGILDNPDKLAKIEAYLRDVREDQAIPTPEIDQLVFGHTHESIRGRMIVLGGKSIECWNPGSLVAPNGGDPDFMPIAIDHEGRAAAF